MKFFSISLLIPCFVLLFSIPAKAQPNNLAEDARSAMLEATRYMVEEVSTNGGYVYHYMPDFSRRWGEVEAYPTQIWIQPSGGTLGMGHLFLDAYAVTGDEYYYQAAAGVGKALAWGQHPSGGWNYMVDFAGDRSLKRWYETIGKNAWGFEEFQHYYGNATFDDDVTAGAARFLLRLYLEKLDPSFRPALDQAIEFILESQYPLGGWPQRYPLKYDYTKGGKADYTSFYTFNDDVMENNIEFLILCYKTLGEERLLDPIRRGMNFYLLAQQGNPQGGWALQYTMDLAPAHARSYEPAALSTGTTVDHIRLLFRFYRYTGDRKFLARIPDAIDWLDRSRLTGDMTEGNRYTHSTFVEVATDKPLYAHRRGSGVTEGHYWVDYNDEPPLRHYGTKKTIDTDELREEYERVRALSSEQAFRDSPLKPGRHQKNGTPGDNFPEMQFPDRTPDESEVQAVIRDLDRQGRWIITGEEVGRAYSPPYSVSGDGVETNTRMLSVEEYARERDPSGEQYLSTREYIKNMRLLIGYINR
ncbi:MAG: pectate lyase [Balneolaceae bacterium]